jgi:hypothetical protein
VFAILLFFVLRDYCFELLPDSPASKTSFYFHTLDLTDSAIPDWENKEWVEVIAFSPVYPIHPQFQPCHFPWVNLFFACVCSHNGA